MSANQNVLSFLRGFSLSSRCDGEPPAKDWACRSLVRTYTGAARLLGGLDAGGEDDPGGGKKDPCEDPGDGDGKDPGDGKEPDDGKGHRCVINGVTGERVEG